MIDLIDFFSAILKQADLDPNDLTQRQRLIAFLQDNDWFGSKPQLTGEQIVLTQAQIDMLKQPILTFLTSSDNNENDRMQALFSAKFPETAAQFSHFSELTSLSAEAQFYLQDFLLYNLHKDLFLMSDGEVSALLKNATEELIKAHGDSLTFFLSWLKSRKRTAYHNEYVMKNRYTLGEKNEAYDFDEYLQLLFYLFNSDYIQDNDMYQLAAESKNYADTWLFLALHFICSLRMTDLVRITHPTLPEPAEQVLDEVNAGTFSDKDARYVLLSITERLCMLPLTPQKTSAHQNIAQIKFTVPESCEVHIGTLFALCEAHYQLSGKPGEPLIRKIADYDRISRYMGDEIGSLFLESNFHSRSANKSYLQSVYMLADDILATEAAGPKVKGYILAALARSHKGSYGKFAETTAVYLKDAKMSGLSAEFVAKELFERGVLSFVPSMLLKMVTHGEYNNLSVSKQTELIQQLDLTPAEVEGTVGLVSKAQRQAQTVVQQLISEELSEEDILTILHRIGSGQAFSKQAESLCLMSACNKLCPYDQRAQCVGCPFEIKTKSTMLLLISEYKRLLKLYKQSETPLEKAKNKKLLSETIVPCLDEVLSCLKNGYDAQVYEAYEALIKEEIQ
ncbi:hypothetical protein IWT25_02216 [Secundilactobacillus pentosiphilus]|uniref:Uncharacterized protein n=1 Tax=Secundilactobacillus pentosiphilus TaxID=1714682 RepID=A0A1Z5IYX6_9LACO|nr:hypothetical protein [Secundilactobacillus pentosiphilus]GAX06869.1 hypothetical protein IWT25_02216 [Secundilactobacillus pentosiphilus]